MMKQAFSLSFPAKRWTVLLLATGSSLLFTMPLAIPLALGGNDAPHGAGLPARIVEITSQDVALLPAGPAECPPDAGAEDPGELAHVRQAIQTSHLIRIVTLGPWGTPASRTGKAMPAVPWLTAVMLKQALPQVTIFLSPQGARGEQVQTTADRLPSILKDAHYDLALWQSGTVEAERNMPPSAYYDALKDGVGRLLSANTDIVLIDLPYSHLLNTYADPALYEDALEQAAVPDGVALYPRFDIMRRWVTTGAMSRHTEGNIRVKDIALQHRVCLARSLMHFILQGAGIKPENPSTPYQPPGK
ncbi:Acyl-CoA thioesterase I [Granulibacter bethesdensis]|nr:Acyl-CoA thioesterase I [Granulibacter bethesdensis]